MTRQLSILRTEQSCRVSPQGPDLSHYHPPEFFRVPTIPCRHHALACAVGCTQAPDPLRPQCLRNVSASTIRAYTNGPTGNSGSFPPCDDVRRPSAACLYRLDCASAHPNLIGSLEDDGTEALVAPHNLSATTVQLIGQLAVFCCPLSCEGCTLD
ncbi:hypothetical protein BJV78DRAFT_616305 [Lactifluus subvellereus]|nr:hypothetical protein BJV78DRAFT_616305 [Lactifluus subvellereus]